MLNKFNETQNSTEQFQKSLVASKKTIICDSLYVDDVMPDNITFILHVVYLKDIWRNTAERWNEKQGLASTLVDFPRGGMTVDLFDVKGHNGGLVSIKI